MKTRTVVVSLGDRHAGLRNGLIAPGTELVYGNITNALMFEKLTEQELANIKSDSDTRRLILSAWSEWLWNDVWLPGIEKVGEIAGKDPVIILDSGDMVHGSRFVESLYTPFLHHQVDISVAAMEPWRKLENLHGIAMVYGTGTHDYGANAAAKKVYEGLAPWGYKLWLGDHLNLKIDGVRIDLAHHGSRLSTRKHLRYNTYRMDIEQKIRENLEFGEPYSDMYHRGHIHNHAYVPILVDWAGSWVQSNLIVNPAMCGPNGYARQATRSMENVVCGFYFWEIVDGRIGTVWPWLKRRDTRAHYTINVEPKKKKGLFKK